MAPDIAADQLACNAQLAAEARVARSTKGYASKSHGTRRVGAHLSEAFGVVDGGAFMHRYLERIWSLAALTLLACSSTDSSSFLTYHRDVAPLMQEKCGGCHVESGIAPFPLETYAQVLERREEIREAVQSRTMPPWLPGPGCAEYVGDLSLSEEQIALITDWVDRGGREGDPAEAPPRPATPPAGGLSRVDHELTMPVEYTPQKEPDDYRCFILDWPEEQVRYVTGFNGKPGTLPEIHHLIAYLILPENVPEVQALDDAEPGPGYTCFGGPGVSNGATPWLGAWAPGSQGGDYPKGSGLEITPGSKIVLQVHYNTSHVAPSPDRTSIQFRVDASVDKKAHVLLWADLKWITDGTMHIPAGEADVVHRWEHEPFEFLPEATGGVFRQDAPFTMHSAALHMHTLGTRGRLEVLRQGSATQCLLDIPRWDFNWQNSYGFQEPKVVQPGDRLALECHWDNSAPGARDVNWGDGTDDEMCLGIFYITP